MTDSGREELLERCPVIRTVAPCVAHALWGQSDATHLKSAQRRQARNIAEDIRKALEREGLLKMGGFTREELEAKDRSQPLGDTVIGISDPMERRIAAALTIAGISYRHESDRERASGPSLDFELPDAGLYIEVKRMHSERIARQMSQAENVIAAQGKLAVEFLAQAIEALSPEPSPPQPNPEEEVK